MATSTASFHDPVFYQDSGTWYPLSKHLAFVGLLQANLQCFAYKPLHYSRCAPSEVEMINAI